MDDKIYSWNGAMWKISVRSEGTALYLERFTDHKSDFPYCYASCSLRALVVTNLNPRATGAFNIEGMILVETAGDLFTLVSQITKEGKEIKKED